MERNMTNKDFPPSYYVKIIPSGVKDELLLQVRRRFRVFEYTNKDTDFSYLEDNQYVVEIYNSYTGLNLFIELTDKFTLYYGEWKETFDGNLLDYNKLRYILKYLLKGDLCVYSLYIDNVLKHTELKYGHSLNLYPLSKYSFVGDKLLESFEIHENKIQHVKKKITRWHNCGSISFEQYRSGEDIITIYYEIDGCIKIFKNYSCVGICLYKELNKNTVMIYNTKTYNNNLFNYDFYKQDLFIINESKRMFQQKNYKYLFILDIWVNINEETYFNNDFKLFEKINTRKVSNILQFNEKIIKKHKMYYKKIE